MILTIDVGNTNVKVAVFEQTNMVEKFVFDKINLQKNILNILKKYSNCTIAILSSVGKLEEMDVFWLKNQVDLIEINQNSKMPFQNLYETPNTLGVDRMVLAAGAFLLYPNTDILIIDAGTCVTYDYVTSNGEYLGGAISPGLKLRYEALHNFTANLPFLSKIQPKGFIGKNTNDAIHSGVVNGLCCEIDGFISEYSVKKEQFTIILTGGDANFLANQLKSIIFADENFLLKSLQQLYIYNLHND